jgi:phage protein U
MTRPLFQLGNFQFDLPNGVPQTLDRTAEYRWETQDRLLRDPAAQFLGPGRQEITLDGQLFPGFSGRQSTMETLRELATQGQPQMLTDGLGRVYGKWAIKQIREGLSTFAPGGGARQIGFSISLVRYVEDNPGEAASPLSMNNASSYAGITSNALAGLTALTSPGSAFQSLSWASIPQFSATAVAAQGAGFSLGQLGAITRSIASNDYVGAALNAFGLSSLSTQQQGIWTQLGISAAQMVQQMTLGRGAPAMSVALDALRPATSGMLTTLGGSGGGAAALSSLVRDAATIATMLDVDPFITGAVRDLVQL